MPCVMLQQRSCILALCNSRRCIAASCNERGCIAASCTALNKCRASGKGRSEYGCWPCHRRVLETLTAGVLWGGRSGCGSGSTALYCSGCSGVWRAGCGCLYRRSGQPTLVPIAGGLQYPLEKPPAPAASFTIAHREIRKCARSQFPWR